jgi:inactivated superfamily I helicase
MEVLMEFKHKKAKIKSNALIKDDNSKTAMNANTIPLITAGATPPRSKANNLNRHFSSELLHTQTD